MPSLLPTLATVLLAAAAVANAAEFVFVSDLHVDLYYGMDGTGLWPCNTTAMGEKYPYGYPDCDAPPRLIESAWSRIEAVLGPEAPRHVVVAGDWLRHRSNLLTDAQNAAAFEYITRMAVKVAGNTTGSSVLPAPAVESAFGNNDVVPDYFFDYRNATRTPLFRNMSGTLRDLGVLSAEEHASFARCAFYSRTIESGRLRVIVVNSLLWDQSLAPEAPSGVDPCGQFAFLEVELAAAMAAGQAVWIVGHIPPTINAHDVFEHRNDTAQTPGSHFWLPAYEDRYWRLVAAFNATIRVQVFAHTHRFAFNADAFVGVPLYVLGAVSPVYDNWPNFFHVTVDDATLAPTRMQQHVFNMSSFAWEVGLELGAAYNTTAGAAPRSIAALRSVGSQLLNNDTAWATWRRMSAGGITTNDCTSQYCRAVGACFIFAAGTARFYRCLQGHHV